MNTESSGTGERCLKNHFASGAKKLRRLKAGQQTFATIR